MGGLWSEAHGLGCVSLPRAASLLQGNEDRLKESQCFPTGDQKGASIGSGLDAL